MTVSTLPPTAVLHRILTKACRAPSVHNSQPWRWRVDGDHVTLLADRTRQLMRADPEGRDLVLSCGAALHHFRVAAAAEGYRPRVVRKPYGVGANALGHPAAALAHLAAVLAGQPRFEAPGPGEIITTGTLTAALPIRPGESWSSSYEGLPGVTGLELRFID